jgi:hypothetical protein
MECLMSRKAQVTRHMLSSTQRVIDRWPGTRHVVYHKLPAEHS